MIVQRARQFFGHHVVPGPADIALAEHFLEAPLLDLFLAQEPRDVAHAANTARWLLDRSHDDRLLLQAALLHDIGKGDQRRRDRVAHVLLSIARLEGLIAGEQASTQMRRALHRSRTHAETGAATLLHLGVDARVAELVRLHHERPGQDGMLELLQEADAAT